MGGGFIVTDEVAADGARQKVIAPTPPCCPCPLPPASNCWRSAGHGACPSPAMRRNEQHWRSDGEIDAGLERIWQVMQACVARGCATEGVLPGGFKVKRRAKALRDALTSKPKKPCATRCRCWIGSTSTPGRQRGNAAGVVVTAPTNGARHHPAVLHYYTKFVPGGHCAGRARLPVDRRRHWHFRPRKTPASAGPRWLSGRAGVARSRPLGAPARWWRHARAGGNAAEIGMEHHLGSRATRWRAGADTVHRTQRIASVKVINAAHAARGDGTHFVSLDKVIKTMRDTGPT